MIKYWKKMKEIKIRHNYIGKVFGELEVLSRADDIITENYKYPAWNCKCSCEKIIITSSYNLKNGQTKSCGHTFANNLIQHYIDKGNYNPPLATAKDLYYSLYRDGNIIFEYFYKLSQMNCFYCGIEPCNKKRNTKKKSSQYMKDNSLFIYNGLDKVNSKLSHNINNVVPCCYICNRAKLDRIIFEFFDYIFNLKNNFIINIDDYRKSSLNIELRDFNEIYIGSSIKKVYSRYKDGKITLEQFYQLSQLPCYYCGMEKTNKFNCGKNIKGYFYYNGIDRIDNSKKHDFDNVITCCSYCNFAKSDGSLEDILIWKDRIGNNYENIKKLIWVA
jgi:hypothetical protein